MESDSENEIELKPIKLMEADATGYFKNLDISESDEDEIDVKPTDISPCVADELDEEDARLTSLNSLPEISKKKYETAYKSFMNWRKHQEAPSFSENALLAYFGELAKKMKSSTLWTLYSMLRATLSCNNNVDITKYSRLRAFLKRQNAGYRPKSSKIFTASEIDRFIKEAPDAEHLVTKVALIMGVIGACRRHELYEMKTTHLNDFGSAVLITIPATKAKTVRNFTVAGRFYEIFKKYANLRPEHANGHWFFLNYHNGICTNQRIGRNKLGAMGKQIARYLKLPNPELYTGHCFRRSSAKIIVDATGDITSLKRLSVWKPWRALEGCNVEDRLEVSDKSLEQIHTSSAAERPSTSRSENWEHQENVIDEPSCSNKRPKLVTTNGSSATTKKIFDPNSQDFAEIRQMPSFVDHSKLLEIFLKTGTTPKFFISAPPHFCKSSNIDMVQKFFEIRDNGKLEEKVGERHMFPTFRDLDIIKIVPLETLEEHFCAHPVLYVDFKEYLIRNFDDALARCFRGIRQAYEKHKILLQKNLHDNDAKEFCQMWWSAKMLQDVGIDNVKAALESLCKILFAAYGRKVVVLIDECDSIFTAALKGKVAQDELQDIASLMEAILGNVTKSQLNKQLQAVLVTGVSHILCGFSENVTLTPCRFLDDEDEDFGDSPQMYGLHDSQLNGLLSRLHKEGLLKKLGDNVEAIKKIIRDNFDGYYTRTGKRILPLLSILHYLKSGKSSIDMSHPVIQIFKNRFSDFSLGVDILNLLANQEINLQHVQKIHIEHLLKLRDHKPNRDLFFTLMMEVGFFTVTRKGNGNTMKIKLANRVIKTFLLSILVDEEVSIGPFQASSMLTCARLITFIEDSLLNDNDVKYKDHFKMFYTVLKFIFKGFGSFQRHLSEHLLSGLLLIILGYTKRFNEVIPECFLKNQDQTNLWMLDLENQFAIIFGFRVSKRPDKNLTRPVDKTSLFALKEIKVRSSGQADYLLELKNRKIQKYLLVGLSIDEENRPSFSIETWKNPDEIICVSENEPIEFEEFYKGCCDLLKEHAEECE